MVAAGVPDVSRNIALHPDEFPPEFAPNFTRYDVAARDVNSASPGQARRFVARFQPAQQCGQSAPGNVAPSSDEGLDVIEEGSNAWAFAPSRTRSGRAILLRNPHLSWTAGYYEAHVTVPGALDFYGDFPIGGPFGVIGGFNRHLGWATTNNAPDHLGGRGNPSSLLDHLCSHCVAVRSMCSIARHG